MLPWIEENSKKDRYDELKKWARDFIKFIIPKYDDIELYIGFKSEKEYGEIVEGICNSYYENEYNKVSMDY